jgi:hypothetical protein
MRAAENNPPGRPEVGVWYSDGKGNQVEVRAIAWPTCVVTSGERVFQGEEFARRFRRVAGPGVLNG